MTETTGCGGGVGESFPILLSLCVKVASLLSVPFTFPQMPLPKS